MKSPLEQVNELDDLIRQLRKLASRIRAGQNVDGWRECNRIIAILEKYKQDLIKEKMEITENNDKAKND